MKDTYKIIGPFYDLLSSLYSGSAIYNCKVAMLNVDNLRPEDKVLFAGVGHGKDAIYAAKSGANVTVVDLSETMLRIFNERLAQNNQICGKEIEIRQVCCDILKFDETEQYDMVIANFFLNVFSERMMVEVLNHLVSLAKPDGKVVVGDFHYPSGNLLSRTIQKVYWYGAVLPFWIFANNAVHKIYNYPGKMKQLGLKIIDQKQFKLLKINCYWSILGQKQN